MAARARQLNWRFDPLEALRRWPADSRLLLLHSGRYDERWARRSILAEPVGSFRFTSEGRSEWIGPAEHCPIQDWTHRALIDLRELLHEGDGVWIGYLSYDLGRWIEPAVRIEHGAQNDRSWPVIELGYCPGYLSYDLTDRTWQACGTWAHEGVPELVEPTPGHAAFSASEPQSVFTRSGYEQAVGKVLEYISAGDVFQVNLAQRFTCEFAGAYPQGPRALFAQLAKVSPAWYGAYLECPGDEQRVIASTSPELFLEVDAVGRVITRPIKGTRPASTPVAELRDSQKDIAELNMIVDLMRNDLGRVCDYGTVQVTQPRLIESHPTVHHGVATITGKLHHAKDLVDLLRATMPGGSVTGAPKIRAMQIIDELEPVQRGPYCGAIGHLSRHGACLNIAIRTMLLDASAGRLDFTVGGGIVADSEPAAEYQETLDKAAAIRASLTQPTRVGSAGA